MLHSFNFTKSTIIAFCAPLSIGFSQANASPINLASNRPVTVEHIDEAVEAAGKSGEYTEEQKAHAAELLNDLNEVHQDMISSSQEQEQEQ